MANQATKDRMKYMDNTGQVKELHWICKRCGLLRSNKQQHIHGVQLFV